MKMMRNENDEDNDDEDNGEDDINDKDDDAVYEWLYYVYIYRRHSLIYISA